MAVDLLPWPKAKFFVPNTNYPLSGGKVYSYVAGTSTPLTTYSDPAGAIPNTNPVILNAQGEASIYLSNNSLYKIDVHDASDVPLSGYPVDNIQTPGYEVAALQALLASSTDGQGVSMVYGAERVVSTIGALRALSKNFNSRVFVAGYYAVGDGGGGHYWYDSSDTTSTDNGGTVIVASDSARWKLIHSGTVSLKQFGAKGDKTTNDTTAVQNALSASGVHAVYAPAGTYSLASQVTVPIRLYGDGEYATKFYRNFSPASDSIGALRFTAGSINSSQDFMVFSATGTTGGNLINLIPDPTNGSPDFITFQSINLTYESINTYKYALYIDGSARTDSVGVRDTTFLASNIFGGTDGTIYLNTVVNFEYHGSVFAGGSTSGKVLVTATGVNDNYYVTFNCGAMHDLDMSRVQSCVIQSASINVLTVASTVVGKLDVGLIASFTNASANFGFDTGKNTVRAWARFNGTTVGTNAPTDGFNVTSVTRNGLGDYTITFTSALPNANYSVVGIAGYSANSGVWVTVARSVTATPLTTTTARIITSVTGANVDPEIVCVHII